MSGGDSTISHGTCGVCKQQGEVERVYFYYDVKCACHSPVHFDMVYHCKNCIPVRPMETKIIFETRNLKHLSETDRELL